MGTELTAWEKELAGAAMVAADKEKPSLSTISLKSGVMSYQGVALPGNQMDCIVVASVMARTYYEGDYDPDNRTNPSCYALSPNTNEDELSPHPSIAQPQATSCVTCPKNVWGSANRGKGKACKAKRRLALIPADGDPAKGEMAVLTIPTTSVRNWGLYVQEIAAGLRRPSWAVVTTVKVVPDAKNQFKVLFSFKSPLGDDLLGAVKGRIELAEGILLTPYSAITEAEPTHTLKGQTK